MVKRPSGGTMFPFGRCQGWYLSNGLLLPTFTLFYQIALCHEVRMDWLYWLVEHHRGSAMMMLAFYYRISWQSVRKISGTINSRIDIGSSGTGHSTCCLQMPCIYIKLDSIRYLIVLHVPIPLLLQLSCQLRRSCSVYISIFRCRLHSFLSTIKHVAPTRSAHSTSTHPALVITPIRPRASELESEPKSNSRRSNTILGTMGEPQ